MRRITPVLVAGLLPALLSGFSHPAVSAEKVFRAGASVLDITPKEFPAIVSGGFLERTAGGVNDLLHARAIVLDDGTTRLAIVVVDNLLMPRDLLDDAKQRAQETTGIPTDHMLISAIHTHSAPSVVGALGTGVDEPYVKRLPGWIAQSIEKAAANLAPAR
ncbi:MAG: hypothetical protein ABIK89_16570, partial [Planctomycetota bacterium]